MAEIKINNFNSNNFDFNTMLNKDNSNITYNVKLSKNEFLNFVNKIEENLENKQMTALNINILYYSFYNHYHYYPKEESISLIKNKKLNKENVIYLIENWDLYEIDSLKLLISFN